MKKRKAETVVTAGIWVGMAALAVYIVIKGLALEKSTLEHMLYQVQQQAIEMYLPGVTREYGETMTGWLWEKIESRLLPASADIQREGQEETDQATSSKIMEENTEFLEAKLLEENQEAGPPESGYENTGGVDAQSTQAEQASTAGGVAENQIKQPVTDIPLEKFQDFEFVMSNFYTVDKTTSMSSEQLDAPALVQMDMRMKTDNSQPQILIYHSHSQEEFIDSIPGDASTTIVGVGEYLASLLRDTYGYQVIHVTDTFDIVDGKLDRNQAYTYAQERVEAILEENPSVEVVIDLHRDGVPDDKRLVTNING